MYPPASSTPSNPYATPRTSAEGRPSAPSVAPSAAPSSPPPPVNPEYRAEYRANYHAGAGMSGLPPRPDAPVKQSSTGVGHLVSSGGKATSKWLAQRTHTLVKGTQRKLERSADRTLSKLEEARAQVPAMQQALAYAEALAKPFQDQAANDHKAYTQAKEYSDALTKNTPSNPDGTLHQSVQDAQNNTNAWATQATKSADAAKGPNQALSQAKNALRRHHMAISSLETGHSTSSRLANNLLKPLADKTPSQKATQVVHNVKALARLDAMDYIQQTVAAATELHPAPAMLDISGEPLPHLLEHYSGIRHTEIWTKAEVAAKEEIAARQDAAYKAANNHDEGIAEANVVGVAMNRTSERQLLVENKAAQISAAMVAARKAAQQGEYVPPTSAGAGASGV
jgi:hypothetical protein